ncbi:hypothetical protein ACFS4T_16850 [Pseudomonas lini]
MNNGAVPGLFAIFIGFFPEVLTLTYLARFQLTVRTWPRHSFAGYRLHINNNSLCSLKSSGYLMTADNGNNEFLYSTPDAGPALFTFALRARA